MLLFLIFFLFTGRTSSLPPSSKVVLVYFLGGCTYSEIIALRFLGRLKGKGWYYTCIIKAIDVNSHPDTYQDPYPRPAITHMFL